MELKDENTDALKDKLHKTKRIMQILTWFAIITVAFFFYEWLKNDKGLDYSLSLLTTGLFFFVLVLDKKYKKIKAELESRE